MPLFLLELYAMIHKNRDHLKCNLFDLCACESLISQLCSYIVIHSHTMVKSPLETEDELLIMNYITCGVLVERRVTLTPWQSSSNCLLVCYSIQENV